MRRQVPLLLLALMSGAALAGARDADLVPAIRAGAHDSVRALLARRDADPDRLLPDGSTALSWAVETQDPQMVRLLLEAGAKPDAARNVAAAPLLLACEHGNADIVGLLLDVGADVTRASAEGVAPLALCAGTVPASLLQRLLAGGADVDKADQRGQTALMWAAAKGRLDNLRVLLAAGADVNRATAKGFTPLFFALKSGQPGMAAAVAEAGGNASHVGPEATTAVQLALYQKDYAFAARMIDTGVDLAAFDRNGNTLLHAAVLASQASLVRQLLARGANPNTPSAAPRVEWRYEANFRSGDYQVPSSPPLWLAAGQGSAEIMELLAGAGADAAFRAADGATILHAAVASGSASSVAAALRMGVDPNLVDDNGRTPLHVLLQERDKPPAEAGQIMRLLAGKGARTDLPNKRGQTAVQLLEHAPESMRTAWFAAFGGRTAGR